MLVEIVVCVFLAIGGLFGLVGSFGLLKLQDTMQRLHAPTKATTLGIGGVLIASMLYFLLIKDSFSFHELMITLFLFLTAPISAHFLAQTHISLRMKQSDLPESGGAYGWSLFDDPPVMDKPSKPAAPTQAPH